MNPPDLFTQLMNSPRFARILELVRIMNLMTDLDVFDLLIAVLISHSNKQESERNSR